VLEEPLDGIDRRPGAADMIEQQQQLLQLVVLGGGPIVS
jgi:hypothetical protein